MPVQDGRIARLLRDPVARGQLVRFATVGVLATGVYLLATWLLQRFAGLGITVAATLAFVLVVAINYVLHYHWTFESTQPHATSLPRFAMTSIGGLAINSVVVWAGTRIMGNATPLVLLAGVAIVVVWNFLLARFWVFFDSSGRG